MKYKLQIILCFLFLSCNSNFKHNQEKSFCQSRFILFVYLGENSKFTTPLLIRTSEVDTSYLQYIGKSQEILERNGFLISEFTEKEFMRKEKILIDNSIYDIMEDYIINHNTKKDLNYWTANNSTIRVILSDSCNNKFITYAVNNLDYQYFENLIKSLNLKKDENIRLRLEYYKTIQTSE